MNKSEKEKKETVTVCAKCLRSSCWQGIFYCDSALTEKIKTKEMTIDKLKELNLEDPDYWTSFIHKKTNNAKQN